MFFLTINDARPLIITLMSSIADQLATAQAIAATKPKEAESLYKQILSTAGGLFYP